MHRRALLRPHDGLCRRALEAGVAKGLASRTTEHGLSSASDTVASRTASASARPEPAREARCAHQQVRPSPVAPPGARGVPAQHREQVGPGQDPGDLASVGDHERIGAPRAREPGGERHRRLRRQRHHVPRHDVGHRLRGGQLGQIVRADRGHARRAGPPEVAFGEARPHGHAARRTTGRAPDAIGAAASCGHAPHRRTSPRRP